MLRMVLTIDVISVGRKGKPHLICSIVLINVDRMALTLDQLSQRCTQNNHRKHKGGLFVFYFIFRGDAFRHTEGECIVLSRMLDQIY